MAQSPFSAVVRVAGFRDFGKFLRHEIDGVFSFASACRFPVAERDGRLLSAPLPVVQFVSLPCADAFQESVTSGQSVLYLLPVLSLPPLPGPALQRQGLDSFCQAVIFSFPSFPLLRCLTVFSFYAGCLCHSQVYPIASICNDIFLPGTADS